MSYYSVINDMVKELSVSAVILTLGTICAERAALCCAVAAGERAFQAIAVVTSNGGTPCGACRQVLAEFGLDIRVLIATPTALVAEHTVGDLLPGAFSPRDLP